MRRLCIHVGLPKTATTFLQRKVFTKLKNTCYVHRNTNRAQAKIVVLLHQYIRSSNSEYLDEFIKEIVKLKKAEDHQTILISDENISVMISDFWFGKCLAADSFIDKLAELKSSFLRGDIDLRFLFVSREPADWLASRYAESAKRYDFFCQEHFEKTVSSAEFKKIINDSLLNFLRLAELSCQQFSDGCFTMLSYDSLKSDQLGFVQKVISFVGENLNLVDLDLSSHPPCQENRLADTKGTWTLKKSETELSSKKLMLNENLRRMVNSYFADVVKL